MSSCVQTFYSMYLDVQMNLNPFLLLVAGDLPNYSLTTLAIVIVAPVIVLIVLSGIAILVFRRIHQNQMERLTAREAEYGTIDGLIASNVGDSTLAVSRT